MKKPTIEAGADPGMALRVYMIAAGLNQKQLAQKVGMTPASLSRKINGTREFKISEVMAIKEALGMSTDEIMQIFLYGKKA